MQSYALSHVSVWLDELSSEEGAFGQALDWAHRLSLPLRAVVDVRSRQCARSVGVELAVGPVLERIKAWAADSPKRVILETSMWQGDVGVGIEQFLRPGGLCVIEDNKSTSDRARLLDRSLRSPEVVLLTQPVPQPVTRVLILCRARNASYVESVARLCQALAVVPLILTVANSEREARLEQSFAEGVCSSLAMAADFDALIADDLTDAVGRIAGWRNCSHVVVERPRSISLWQRLRCDIFSQIRRLSGEFNVLAVPETMAFGIHAKIWTNRFQSSQTDPDRPKANNFVPDAISRGEP
jgi:hypothetical protein